MAIWNRRSPSAAQPNPAVNPTDVAIARINSAIATENDKIEKLYSEIGKEYVRLHTADYEETFLEQMQALAASQKKLADYSQQMQFVTGIIVCTNCGHKAPKGSIFCNKCGHKLPELNLDKYEICRQCGSLIEKGQSTCPNCSRPTEPPDFLTVQCPHCKVFVGKENKYCPVCGKVLFQDNTTTAPYGKSCEKKCPCCGAITNDKMLFCTECGFKLDD